MNILKILNVVSLAVTVAEKVVGLFSKKKKEGKNNGNAGNKDASGKAR